MSATQGDVLRPLRVGLTGGIGSGKSTVAAHLLRCGAAVMDADAISRRLTAAQGLGIPAILREFGPIAIAPDGAMNRDHMRALVFSDPGAKRRLEQIIHPLVGQENERLVQHAMDAGHRCLVFDIPLLVESAHWRPTVDRVLVVDCLPETQIARVRARNGLTRDAVRAIIAQQATRQQRLAAADTVIFNDDLSLVDLQTLIDQLAKNFGL